MRTLVRLAFAVLLAACEHRIPLGSLVDNEADAGSNGGDQDGSAADDAGVAGLCERKGPIIDVGDGAATFCPADARKRAFRYGICSCESFQNSAETVVDAFDSREGPFTSGEDGGSLGANQSVYPRELTVSGDVVVAGADGMPLMADIKIGGDLLDRGQLDGTAFRAQIAGDARIAGNVHLAGLTVGGNLTVGTNSDVAIAEGAPPFTVGDIEVTPPCDCESPFDVAAMIADAARNNDNRAVDLDPAEGLRSLNGPLERTLPCGTYYVDAFYAPQPITLTITGHVALFVNSSIVAEQQGDIEFVLTNGGELDLFVAKGISTTRRFELGDAASAGRVRVYVGKESNLFFGGETTISGSIYAPQAPLDSKGPFTAFGAVHARAITSAAPFTVHYDGALLADSCQRATTR
jgi:hypothetical protein